MKFSDRLRFLRHNRGLTNKQLAQQSHISHQAISNYECGITLPRIDTAIILADFFGVSLDYLVGRTDKK